MLRNAHAFTNMMLSASIALVTKAVRPSNVPPRGDISPFGSSTGAPFPAAIPSTPPVYGCLRQPIW